MTAYLQVDKGGLYIKIPLHGLSKEDREKLSSELGVVAKYVNRNYAPEGSQVFLNGRSYRARFRKFKTPALLEGASRYLIKKFERLGYEIKEE